MAKNAKVQAKCLCNASAKAEMFSLKQALSAIKNSYDAKAEGVREYITDTLGIGAKALKDLKWESLKEYCVAGKTGRYSTWGVLNALPKWKAATDESASLEAAKQRLAKKAEKKTDKPAKAS